MSLLPFNLWALSRSQTEDNRSFPSLPIILGTGAVFISHYPSALIHLPIYIIWILSCNFFNRLDRKKIIGVFSSLGVSLVLTSPWWASAFLSRHLVQMEGMTRGFANYRDQFLHPFQWFSFYWNFGASVKGTGDTVSFQIGNIAIILILVGWLSLWVFRDRTKNPHKSIWPAMILLVLTLFLTTEYARSIWATVSLLPMLQFPFLLLRVPALLLALLGGSAMVMIDGKFFRYRRSILPVTGLFIVLGSYYMCHTAVYLEISEPIITTETVAKISHTHCTGEFIPQAVGNRFPPKTKLIDFKIEKIPEEGFSREVMEKKLETWLEKAPFPEYWTGEKIEIGSRLIRPGTFQIIDGQGLIGAITGHPTDRTVIVQATTPVELIWGQFYFPGWQGSVNGQDVNLTADPDSGLIRLSVQPGKSTLNFRYKNLRLSNFLSLIALICLFILTGIFIVSRARQTQ